MSKKNYTVKEIGSPEEFKKVVEEVTNGMRTVDHKYDVHIVQTEKAGAEKEIDLLRLLSKHFDTKVVSWCDGTKNKEKCVWLICENKCKTKMLSVKEMKRMAKEKGYVKGIVKITLDDMIDCDRSELEDMLSERLTGSILLHDMKYKAVCMSEGYAYFEVKGDPSLVIMDSYKDLEDAN